MTRKSLRQLISRQPTCANCNSICVNQEHLFSDALPHQFQQSAGFTRHDENESVKSFPDNGANENESSGADADATVLEDSKDEKPEINPDGSVHISGSSSMNFDSRKKPRKGRVVTIFDALLKVFEFQWKYQKAFLKSTETQKANLRLCNDCTECLSQVYDWFLRFTKLAIDAKQKSYLQPLVFPKLGRIIAVKDQSVARDRDREEEEEEQQYSAPASGEVRQRGRKRNILETKALNEVSASSQAQHRPPGLRPIKTSFSGDLKSLLPCKVELCEMTPETVQANLDKIKLEEDQDMDASIICSNQERTFPSDDGNLEDYKVVDDDPDFLAQPQVQNRIQKRKPGRPRKHPIVEKVRQKRPKGPQTTDCDECGKTLRTSVLLKAHIRIYHQNQYNCSYCGERYSDRKQLKEHLNTIHEDEKTEICEDCKKRFFIKNDLKKHSLIHIDRQEMVCNICNGVFPSETHLKAHKLAHVDSEAKLPIYKCPMENCNKRYTEVQLLHSHVRYMHERRNFFVCPYSGCKKSFGTVSYLNAHVVSHERIGTHLCELCGKNYKHKKDLRIHEQRYHSESTREELKGFACGVCPKRYFRADHLRTHRVKASHYVGGREPELPEPALDMTPVIEEFRCVTCNKVFVSDRALKSHFFTHDEDDVGEDSRPFACTECNRKYTNLKALEYHAKYMHKLKGSFACSYCPKSFGRLSSFKRHLSVHSNTQHICGECSKSYKNKIDLVHHYRREHVMSEKNYEHECGVCSKRFYRKDMLRTHLVKTGHTALRNSELVDEEEQEEDLAIFIMEETDIQEEEEAEEILDEDDSKRLLQEEEVNEEDMLTQSIEHTMGGIPVEEMVEITGEDEEGTIAHVVMVDDDVITEDIETEVICTVGPQDDIDVDLTMLNYSIQLE